MFGRLALRTGLRAPALRPAFAAARGYRATAALDASRGKSADLEGFNAKDRHVIGALVVNEAGVLAGVATLLAGRGFNIDSLVVGRTEIPELSRMTIVVNGDDTALTNVRALLLRSTCLSCSSPPRHPSGVPFFRSPP